MKSKLKKLKGTAREIEVTMSKESVDKVFDEVLGDIKKNVNIPGFRPGKAPMDVIQKNHQEEALDEVKQRLVPQAYQRALDEHSITPVSYPEITDVNISLAGELSFKAKVDVHPEVKIKHYTGIKVARNKVNVTEEEVSETLERLKNMYVEFIDTSGPLKKGEFAICDVESFMDGKAISKKRENMWIEVSKEASMLGIGEELEGLSKGDSKEMDVTLPEKYPDEKYAGKKAVFKVEVKETKEKKLPALDDELAKKAGKETLDELRSELKEQLAQRKEADEKISMKNQIMTSLIQKHPFDIPESMVARQLKVLMDKAENELAQKGVQKDVIESHKEKLKDQLLKEAENKVRLYFILDAIASKENVEVSDEEIDNWIKTLATSYNQPFEDVKKYYQEHKLVEGLREQLREDKTLDLLLAEAVITEKK